MEEFLAILERVFKYRGVRRRYYHTELVGYVRQLQRNFRNQVGDIAQLEHELLEAQASQKTDQVTALETAKTALARKNTVLRECNIALSTSIGNLRDRTTTQEIENVTLRQKLNILERKLGEIERERSV